MKKIQLIGIAVMLSSILLLNGCGGGGNAQTSGLEFPSPKWDQSSSDPRIISPSGNIYSLNSDYGLQGANFLVADGGYEAPAPNGTTPHYVNVWAEIAKSNTDANNTVVFKVSTEYADQIKSGVIYNVGAPGSLLDVSFANGHLSTRLNTVSGTIIFNSFGTYDGDLLDGSFVVVLEDGNSDISPKPTYEVKGSFTVRLGSFGSIVQTPIPVAASDIWSTKCGACHSLANVDSTSAGGAPDLAEQGSEIDVKFGNGKMHNNITLTQEDIQGLKMLVNAHSIHDQFFTT